MDLSVNLTSFGVDRDGELYLATTGGKLYRLVPIR